MSNFLKNFYLSSDTLNVFLIMNLVFLKNFNGHLKKYKF